MGARNKSRTKEDRPRLAALHQLLESGASIAIPFDLMDILMKYLVLVPSYETIFIERHNCFTREKIAPNICLEFWGPLLLEEGFPLRVRYKAKQPSPECIATDLKNGLRLADTPELNLRRTDLDDLTPIKHLRSLRYLNLAETAVSDLRPIAGLVGLKELDISWTQVTDLGPVQRLRRLTTLKMSYTGISDLSPLRGAVYLSTLDIDSTPVTSVEPLCELTKLRKLSARDTTVYDFSSLNQSVMVYAGSGTLVVSGMV